MFENRTHAGELLGVKIRLELKNVKPDIIVGITRGGVVAAVEVAKMLRLPLDIIVIKKIGTPGNPELAVGAIGPGNSTYLDKRLLRMLNITREELMPIVIEKEHERFDHELLYRKGRKQLAVRGKIVILVDDGIATGATVLCAKKYFSSQKAKGVVLAVPVISEEAFHQLEGGFLAVIALRIDREFRAVGQYYKEFHQVTDKEVIRILRD
ncbi:MAG: phosphoribosyltransferase [Candidatus Levybacteria bacterium]|nr:phosphoribosyltransferase [Candidatus Levybacteria bacterium]